MHSRFPFVLLIIGQIIFPIWGYSKCLTDIYSAGVSFDSLVYKIEETSSDYATLSSKSGYGVKLAWFQYCPDSKLEMSEYIRLRTFELDITDPVFSGLDKDISLLSFGFEARYFFKDKTELIGEVEAREDLGFDYDYRTNSIYDSPYMNLKVAGGARYYIKSNKTEDYALSTKLGFMTPLTDTDKADSGYVIDVDLEYFRRIAARYSIRADLYYSFYKQNFDDVDFSRHELGVRANYVFRY